MQAATSYTITRDTTRPSATTAELRAWLAGTHGAAVGHAAIWRTLDRLGLARKKRVRAAGQDRPDVAEAQREWVAAQPSLDPASLVFLDETWAATNMARRYGRAPRGQRALDAVPHGHWKTTTAVARHRRPRPGRDGLRQAQGLLRSEAARTVEALWAAIGHLPARFPPAECARYLAHRGYARSE